MKPMQIAVLVTIGWLSTSIGAMAAPNAMMNRDSDVLETSNPSSEIINFVEEEQEVEVLSCGATRCKIKIPGPDGYVRKSFLDMYEEEEEEAVPDLQYGPDTCEDGFVWREAIPGDHVCVTPAARAEAATENAIAGSRVDPGGAYGPNSCIAGFVWREAYRGDVVCVTSFRRTQVENENSDGPSHRVQ